MTKPDKMKQNDIFNKGFDEGTQIKLHIIKKYIQEWLPVFLKKKEKYWKDIYLYDLFAGEGKDAENINGSPLIMLEELIQYCKTIKNENLNVNILFNEYDKKRVQLLEQNINEAQTKCNNSESCPNLNTCDCVLNLNIESKSFKELFLEQLPAIKAKNRLPRFMFLDQFGIKQITEDIFRELVSFKRTDFIFFISSSFASRFAEQPEFKTYLKLSRQSFDTSKPYHCHRVVFNYYKQLIPNNVEYYLAPFSIKKGKNIYGLIFGTNHMLGIEKFLNICWGINKNTGDANYDIDNENIKANEPSLFPEMDKPNKLQVFKNEVKEKITSGHLKTNTEVYRFTFDMGCLPKHANEELRELKKLKIISNNLKTCSSNVHNLAEEKIIL